MSEKRNGACPKEITVLVAEPGQPLRVRKILPYAEAIGKIVGGSVTETCPFAEPVAIIYNGCGDELRLPGWYLLRNGSGEPYAVIRGTFLVAGVYNGAYVSLTDAQIMWLLAAFSRDRLPDADDTERAVSGRKRRGQPVSFPPVGRQQISAANEMSGV